MFKIPPDPQLASAARPNTFRLSDLLVLIACVAIGLACSRSLVPHRYRASRLHDPEWVFFRGVVPAVFGAANLGLPATLLLRAIQRRGRRELTAMELAGLATTCTILSPFALGAFVVNLGGAGLLKWLIPPVVVALSGVSACIALLHRLLIGERFHWKEIQGVLAAVVPAVVIPYWVITSLPIR